MHWPELLIHGQHGGRAFWASFTRHSPSVCHVKGAILGECIISQSFVWSSRNRILDLQDFDRSRPLRAQSGVECSFNAVCHVDGQSAKD